MTVPTCRQPSYYRSGQPLRLCGKPATWHVGFSDGTERTEYDVCDEHLLDAQDDPDYVGARGL